MGFDSTAMLMASPASSFIPKGRIAATAAEWSWQWRRD
jgi:hypothetical protein